MSLSTSRQNKPSAFTRSHEDLAVDRPSHSSTEKTSPHLTASTSRFQFPPKRKDATPLNAQEGSRHFGPTDDIDDWTIQAVTASSDSSSRHQDINRAESSMMNRASSLRRITTSPHPEPPVSDQLASRSLLPSRPSYQRTANKHRTTPSVENPLFLTLTDALSNPYVSISPTPVASRLSYDETSFDDQQTGPITVWTPIEDHTEGNNHLDTSSETGDDDGTWDPYATAAAPLEGIGHGLDSFPSIESDLSYISDERRFSHGNTELSGAAAELFRGLKSPGQRGYKDGDPELDAVAHREDYSRPASTNRRRSDARERDIGQTHQQEQSTWRSTLSDETYQALLAHYDVFEMRRQEVIWELCRTEDDFVQSLQIVLKLFVQPLRAENGTRWIPGLDSEVAKLFDWLDDIVQLHTQLHSTMSGCRINQVRYSTAVHIPLLNQINVGSYRHPNS